MRGAEKIIEWDNRFISPDPSTLPFRMWNQSTEQLKKLKLSINVTTSWSAHTRIQNKYEKTLRVITDDVLLELFEAVTNVLIGG